MQNNQSKILHLNLKGEYFDAIKNGKKPFEYRLKNEYWTKKLVGIKYDDVFFKRGYPKNHDADKIIKIPYRGYEIQTITHEHFGKEPVEVFAIYVTAVSNVDMLLALSENNEKAFDNFVYANLESIEE